MTKKDNIGWCWKDPWNNWQLARRTFRTRTLAVIDCEDTFVDEWKKLYRRGFRVVKVEIVEVKK